MSDQPPSEGQGGDKLPEEELREGPPESPVGDTIIPPSSDFMQQPTGGAYVTEPAAPSPVEPDPAATIRMGDAPPAPPQGEYTPPQGGYTPPPPAPTPPGPPQEAPPPSPLPPVNQPPPQAGYAPPPGGGMPPQGGYTPPPQGGYAPPPQGGYAPPPQGSYPPPQGAQGGYAPPPQGGYAPQQGGYAPPPGSNVPPAGGYGPPPPGGYGYGAPPPPPGGSGTAAGAGGVNMSAINMASIQSYFRKSFNVVMQYRTNPYPAEAQNANWNDVVIAVGSVTIVAFVASLISALIHGVLPGSLGGYGGYMSMAAGGGGIFGAILEIFIVPIIFFCGAGILWLSAKVFGGQGQNFMEHCYLLSLSYTPTRLVLYALTILNISVLGILVALAALFLLGYQIYHAGMSMAVSQRMEPNRAQMAAWVPAGIGFVFACLCVGLTTLSLVSFYSIPR